MPIGHPSGPNLPGHQNCGPGMIFDHQARRCITLTAYRKKYGGVGSRTASKKKKGNTRRA